MSRKDYILLANAIKDAKIDCKAKSAIVQFNFTINRIANALKTDNPNFNADTFKSACGFEL